MTMWMRYGVLGIVMTLAFSAHGDDHRLAEKEVEEYETVEWQITNPDWEDNPFDVKAKAVFFHKETGESVRTSL